MELTKDCEFSPIKHGQCKCKSIVVNFRRLESLEMNGGDQWCPPAADLLHVVAGLCTSALPDMEMHTIYSCLTGAGSKVIVVIRECEGIIEERKKLLNVLGEHRISQASVSPKAQSSLCTSAADVTEEPPGPFTDLFTDTESEESSEEDNDAWCKSRLEFAERAQLRRTADQLAADSVGAEHRVMGCAAFTRLSSKPSATAVQLTLLAVRRSFRQAGVGSYLLECCKDPAVVGDYDVLLTFADHKAEAFFTHQGFTDDPIIASRYRAIADVYQNSTLMCYITPFSGPGLSLDILTALKQANLHMSAWREQATDAYWHQLTFMERLRHELLVVHGKCESQEEMIAELKSQLMKAREEKALVEGEFLAYRKQTQKLLCELTAARAEQWLAENEQL